MDSTEEGEVLLVVELEPEEELLLLLLLLLLVLLLLLLLLREFRRLLRIPLSFLARSAMCERKDICRRLRSRSVAVARGALDFRLSSVLAAARSPSVPPLLVVTVEGKGTLLWGCGCGCGGGGGGGGGPPSSSCLPYNASALAKAPRSFSSRVSSAAPAPASPKVCRSDAPSLRKDEESE